VSAINYSTEPHGIFFLIDNKSFYASVESVERGLNPLRSILVVMSEQDNTNGGLVLATSPRAKDLFGIHNVDRWRDLPHDSRLMIVPPRMNLYIKKNLAINKIFTQFTTEQDVYPYSIDESILDMTHSWNLFGKTPQAAAHQIQVAVKKQLGLYTTVGIGENPLQAKLALDLFAKNSPQLSACLTYNTFAAKVWPITRLTNIWSIGQRTAAHLQRLGINSIGELAHTNPAALQREFGIIGTQLFALAWGIDRSQLEDQLEPRKTSLENSQVLPRDYYRRSEIEVVIKEICQQVAARMRHRHLCTSCIRLSIGYSLAATTINSSGFAHEQKIELTDNSFQLEQQLLNIFSSSWNGAPVRRISVGFSQLVVKQADQLNLFLPPEQQLKQIAFNQLIDQIRGKFGKGAIMYANSLTQGGTFKQRINLVGGHNGGNTFE
jgi:DNA polymerase V